MNSCLNSWTLVKALHRLSLYLPKEVGSSKSLKCVEVNELKKENIISARAFFGTFPGRHFSYDVNTFMGNVNTVQKETDVQIFYLIGCRKKLCE